VTGYQKEKTIAAGWSPDRCNNSEFLTQ